MPAETLLLEIGAEELPAGYIQPALAALQTAVLEKLRENHLPCGAAHTLGTPRRLAIMVTSIAPRQKDRSVRLMGPPAAVGMDDAGNFTVPAQKFAEKAGLAVGALRVEQTEKGAYLCAEKKEKGRPARTVLSEILPQVIASLPFPKTMRWADRSDHFARPVHSLTALLGKSVIRFTWAGITSGRYSFGHFFMAPKKVKISHAEDYPEVLKAAGVWPDIAERRALVVKESEQAAASLGGMVLPDTELVDTVTQMVEYPVASAGRFAERFLELPPEVLITAMRSHQKYFAVIDRKERLLPCFIAVNNTRAADMEKVTAGHERVLRARLEDAMFFYRKDREKPLSERVQQLRRVLFQAELGSMHDKMRRLRQLVKTLAPFYAGTNNTGKDLAEVVTRAAELCKADLITHMVDEFPKLQGTMGRVYALAEGEPEAVGRAIEEHYYPLYSGAVLPASPAGALLAIADKMDTICGCFLVGLVPSGTADPYALRRQGIGIIQILLDQDLQLSLPERIADAVRQYTEVGPADKEPVVEAVYEFLRGRMAQLLIDEGYAKDIVTAVLNASARVVPDVWRRVRALSDLKSRPDFEPLAVAFKRVTNIMKKSPASAAAAVAEDIFEHPGEAGLYAAGARVRERVDRALANRKYEQALREIAALREPVDRFFDDVMVMAEDPALRENRLALLGGIAAIFSGFADFSAIATE